MKRRKFFLFFGVLLVLCWTTVKAQPTGSIAIALSEICVSNIGPFGQTDFNGNRGDWVELYSSFTSSVNLSGWYLSNDRANLFKWPFPTGFIMGPGQYRALWLSGKNTHYGNEYHTNFTLDQCRGQSLILTGPDGTVQDSVFIFKTKEGHSRGRVAFSASGPSEWRIFTTPTYQIPNTGANYVSYAPKPVMKISQAPITAYTGTNPGGFYSMSEGQTGLVNIYLEYGIPYDSLETCFRIYYTLDNGNYPVPGNVGTTQLLDTNGVVISNPATLIRAISVPFSSNNPAAPSGCEQLYLPSFCETNTYFIHPNYSDFSPDFGVVSIAMDYQDTSWFNSNGSIRPVVHVEYYDKQQQLAEGYTQLNRPVQEAWVTKQKGFYMTIDDRRGFGCNFEGDIFNVDSLGSSKRKVFPTLHLKAGDYESHSLPIGSVSGLSGGTGLMDVFYQSLAAKNNLNVNPLHIKPVVTFINGKYRGVYDLREVYDKYYENYYNQQSVDSVDLEYYHYTDGFITYNDGPSSSPSTSGSAPADRFANSVYSFVSTNNINLLVNYNKLFSKLDKSSFIDYMILNSYAMNGNLWNYNYDIAFARGAQAGMPGDKWHYYLWNVPAIFNFAAITLQNDQVYTDYDVNPCFVHSNPNYASLITTPDKGNSHGFILKSLMTPQISPPNAGSGKYLFQTEYKNRYQDLLNGPLKCESILKHYDYVTRLFAKEARYHEDPSSVPVPGDFVTTVGEWDTNVVIYRRGIDGRCQIMANAFGSKFSGCYGMRGPYAISVDVRPAGAGHVKLNTLFLDNYIWYGNYFATVLSLKATPVDDSYVFDHWEFKTSVPMNDAPLSFDSLQINFNQADDIVAVFTDKKKDITMPTGFTPNGDGINDVFQPVGSALYSQSFDMSVWNRWGQQVYRSTDPRQGWDGNYKGEQAQTGVYAYVISYKNMFNESKILKGNITLLR